MLRLVDLDKRFGATHAVRGASLEFEAGRIHAVVGENGAGKSTLLRMAAGIERPDSGEVRIGGTRLSPHTAAEAIARGVGMVQQHFALIGVFSALENVVLGVEPTRGGVLDLKSARKKIDAIAKELGTKLPLDAPVESLGVGDRQRLEIARALYRDAKVLILDEPTAVLTPSEAEALYGTLRRLADHNRAIIVVTHKLDEVSDHADLVTVVRKGQVVLTRELDELKDRNDEIREIAEAMMGGGLPDPVLRQPRTLKEHTIIVDRVTLGRKLVDLTFHVKAGEVVGIAGVEGNGQRELVQVLAGEKKPDTGVLRILPRPLVGAGVRRLAIVHEDRHEEGLILDATVRDNVVLGELARYAGFLGILDTRSIDRDARERLERAQAKGSRDTLARALSGGNQQKIVVARAVAQIELGASGLVLSHPTRGVDLGASRAIHREIQAAATKEVAVLVISADLAELRAVCDRILVMARGTIVAELPPTASDNEIGRAMLGARAS